MRPLRALLERVPRRRAALLEDLRHADNAVVLQALRRLQARGWTQDGSLCGLDFSMAQWQGAHLARASLGAVILRQARLDGAYLHATDLRAARLDGACLLHANLGDVLLAGASLRGADLRGAHLAAAGLQEADLREADLRGANLWQADLRAADLSGARLEYANLSGIRRDCRTRLPQGQA